MRRFLAALAATSALVASPALAAIGTPTIIASGNTGSTATDPYALTTTAAVAAGDAIVVVVNNSTSATGLAITDTAGNTYSVLSKTGPNSNGSLWVAYCTPCLALPIGGTITATWTNSSRVIMGAFTVSGLATSLPVDFSGAAVGGTGTTLSITSGTLANASELALGFTVISQQGTWTTAPGFSPLTAVSAGAFDNTLFWSYQITTTTAAVSYAPSWTASKQYAANLYTFKAAGGGGGSTCKPGSLLLLGVGC